MNRAATVRERGTSGGDSMAEKRKQTVWPTFAALALMLLALYNAAPMGVWMWQNLSSSRDVSAGEIARTLVSWPMALGVLNTMAACWLFVAAGLLIVRVRASRARLLEWSVAAIVLTVISGGDMVRRDLQYRRDRQELAEWSASLPELGELLARGQPLDQASVMVLLLSGLLPPALMWWWLRRPRIRAEIAEWGSTTGE